MFTKTFTIITALLIMLALFGIAFAEKNLGEKETNGYTVKAVVSEDGIFTGKTTTFKFTITKDGNEVYLDTPPDLKLCKMVDGYKCPMGCKGGESEKSGKCPKCKMDMEKAKIRKTVKDKLSRITKGAPYTYEGKITAAGSYQLDWEFKPEKEEKEFTVTFDLDAEEPPAENKDDHPKGGNMPGGHKH